MFVLKDEAYMPFAKALKHPVYKAAFVLHHAARVVLRAAAISARDPTAFERCGQHCQLSTTSSSH